MNKAICSIDGCEKQAHARSWCAMHYQRWRADGDPGEAARRWEAKTSPTCSLPECERPVRARGWCGAHYERWRTHGSTEDPARRTPEDCSVDGCRQEVLARGLCPRHYDNRRRYGDPLSNADRTPMQRLEHTGWDVTEAGCWEWRGTRGARGYGYIRINDEPWIASRLMLTLTDPQPSEDSVTRHSCDNPPCVNPDHLSWGSTHDNSQDMVERRRDLSYRADRWAGRCRNGLHDITAPGSTVMDPSGAWRCRLCREASYRRKAERRAARRAEARKKE